MRKRAGRLLALLTALFAPALAAQGPPARVPPPPIALNGPINRIPVVAVDGIDLLPLAVGLDAANHVTHAMVNPGRDRVPQPFVADIYLGGMRRDTYKHPPMAAILGWTILPAWGFAPQPGRETDGVRADSVPVDACTVAPMEQLRFVVTAGLGRAFPIRENREGSTVWFADPNLVTATCPNLRVDLALTLREELPRASPSGAIAGTLRLAVRLSTTAAFTVGPGKLAHSAAALADAAICVRRVDLVDLTIKGASPWLTPAWVAARMEADLVGRACFDVTSLVYVFLQRGGTLTRVR